MDIISEDDHVSRAEAARLLNQSLYGFDRLVRDGLIAPERVPGRACPRYRRRDVEALLEAPEPLQSDSPRVAHTIQKDRFTFGWTSISPDGETITYEFVGRGRLTITAEDKRGAE